MGLGFSRAVDGEQFGDGLVLAVAAAGGQEDKLMAEATGAVDVVGIAGIDPEIQAVAFFDATFAAPEGLLFTSDRGGEE